MPLRLPERTIKEQMANMQSAIDLLAGKIILLERANTKLRSAMADLRDELNPENEDGLRPFVPKKGKKPAIPASEPLSDS